MTAMTRLHVGDRVRVKDGTILNDLWEPYREMLVGSVKGIAPDSGLVGNRSISILLDASPWKDAYREVYMSESNVELIDDHV